VTCVPRTWFLSSPSFFFFLFLFSLFPGGPGRLGGKEDSGAARLLPSSFSSFFPFFFSPLSGQRNWASGGFAEDRYARGSAPCPSSPFFLFSPLFFLFFSPRFPQGPWKGRECRRAIPSLPFSFFFFFFSLFFVRPLAWRREVKGWLGRPPFLFLFFFFPFFFPPLPVPGHGECRT